MNCLVVLFKIPLVQRKFQITGIPASQGTAV